MRNLLFVIGCICLPLLANAGGHWECHKGCCYGGYPPRDLGCAHDDASPKPESPSADSPNAGKCSQAQAEQDAIYVAKTLSKDNLHATRIIVGKGAYEGVTGKVIGYFPVFFVDADCEDNGLKKCDLSAVLFANLATCTVTSGPINVNLSDR